VQLDDDALGLGQPVERGAHARGDVSLHDGPFGVRRAAAGARLLGGGERLLAGVFTQAKHPPQLVPAHVRRDREEPGTQRHPRLVARATTVDSEEGRLKELVAHGAISKGAEEEPVNAGSQRRKEPPEGLLVAGRISQHEILLRGVPVAAIRSVSRDR
jgi:hypothetical protein